MKEINTFLTKRLDIFSTGRWERYRESVDIDLAS